MAVILLAGASGFIGSRLAAALLAAGHRVIGTARHRASLPEGVTPLEVDYGRDTDAATWTTRLSGVEVAINAVGAIRQRRPGDFEAIHVRAPTALFSACVAAGVRRVVQISALGADGASASAYHRTKHAADEALRALPLRACIVQPSLVFGADGASTRALLALASLPAFGLSARAAAAPVQPVHVDDLVAAIVRWIDEPDGHGLRGTPDASAASAASAVTVAAVGPEAMTFVGYLQELRAAMGLGVAPVFGVPRVLVAICARQTAGPEGLAMLERGNAAPADDFTRLLGRPPRTVCQFVPQGEGALLRLRARLDLLLPVLRASLAALWIGTALLSFGLYPRERSFALLASVGVVPAWQPLLLYAGAALDALLGLGILLRPRWRATWLAQIALMTGYTAILSWRAPGWWLHPFAPLLKNVPLLAVTLLLLALLPPPERR